jgi:hypothetical protein
VLLLLLLLLFPAALRRTQPSHCLIALSNHLYPCIADGLQLGTLPLFSCYVLCVVTHLSYLSYLSG